jgi:hypothetical protein
VVEGRRSDYEFLLVQARAVGNGEAKSALEQTGRHKLRLKGHWIADHDFGYQIGDAGYSDFFDFLAKAALNVCDDEEEIAQEDEGET